jgi:diaminohydroxyphosphoribosylaminopyrimidine deaminase / 5-amino-6-(5-phosphoribosylamino)uracil reductase
MTPEQAMARALARARRASGRTWPNPPVGAVLLRGDRVLGAGETRAPGGPHAEIVALAQARARHGARALVGATLAVTLEPCCHHGRTPPCTDALLAAGIRRVWIGQRDPNPQVAGRGLAQLRRAGVSVRLGVAEAECREQHRGFLSVQRRGRPWVSLKLAATLDGRIATARGESRWLTGPAARALVHRLRDAADAVMVGSGTAASDDPELSVRRGGRRVRTPVRLLVDGGLRVSERARLFRDAEAVQTWLLTRRGHAPRRLARRTARGARALLVPARGGRLDLARAFALLAHEGLTHVFVEGGGGLAAALLRAGLVDELHWFLAPSLLGGDARPALGALAIEALAERIPLALTQVRRLGPDLYVRALLSDPGGPA